MAPPATGQAACSTRLCEGCRHARHVDSTHACRSSPQRKVVTVHLELIVDLQQLSVSYSRQIFKPSPASCSKLQWLAVQQLGLISSLLTGWQNHCKRRHSKPVSAQGPHQGDDGAPAEQQALQGGWVVDACAAKEVQQRVHALQCVVRIAALHRLMAGAAAVEARLAALLRWKFSVCTTRTWSSCNQLCSTRHAELGRLLLACRARTQDTKGVPSNAAWKGLCIWVPGSALGSAGSCCEPCVGCELCCGACWLTCCAWSCIWGGDCGCVSCDWGK